jgi:hypothetical protein
MGLAHHRLQPARPAPVQIAEPGIAEPVGRTGPVLLPQQRQGHIGAAQLAMLAGEKLFVDFTGRTGEVVDGLTGEIQAW